MSDTFGVIISALKDLLKFKIIQSISTGDKTYDSLLQTLCISIMTAITGIMSIDLIKTKYKTWRYDRIHALKITDSNTDIFKYYATVSKDSTSTIYQIWYVNDENEEFTNKFVKYIQEYANWVIMNISRPIAINPITKKPLTSFGSNGNLDTVLNNIKIYSNPESLERKYIPLCVYKGGCAGVTANRDGVLLYATKNEAMMYLLDEINSITLKNDNICNITPIQRRIFSYNQSSSAVLYQDRTLDTVVSRHIPKIKNALENFKLANKSKSKLGGFGTYNLGFMLYGRPGTGKTLIIKAIANYLGRDINIIDMRTIKTKNHSKIYSCMQIFISMFMYLMNSIVFKELLKNEVMRVWKMMRIMMVLWLL